jgi:hypothetical protein
VLVLTLPPDIVPLFVVVPERVAPLIVPPLIVPLLVVVPDSVPPVSVPPEAASAPVVERTAAASASSSTVRMNEDTVVVLAVPLPVKYGNVSAADVSPASALNSASYAWTFVPITSPRYDLAFAAVAYDKPVAPLFTNTGRFAPPDNDGILSNPVAMESNSERMVAELACDPVDGAPDEWL